MSFFSRVAYRSIGTDGLLVDGVSHRCATESGSPTPARQVRNCAGHSERKPIIAMSLMAIDDLARGAMLFSTSGIFQHSDFASRAGAPGSLTPLDVTRDKSSSAHAQRDRWSHKESIM
jgi:hypothetical protein